MADFSHLKPLHVSGETLAEYVFTDIPGGPSIWFAPATDANPDFLSARLRVSLERAEAAANAPVRREELVEVDDIEADREVDRKLLSQTCAKRWGTVPLDKNGDAPEFTAENVYDFFRAVPNYVFDPLRGFTANPRNFVDRTALAKVKTTEGRARELGNS